MLLHRVELVYTHTPTHTHTHTHARMSKQVNNGWNHPTLFNTHPQLARSCPCKGKSNVCVYTQTLLLCRVQAEGSSFKKLGNHTVKHTEPSSCPAFHPRPAITLVCHWVIRLSHVHTFCDVVLLGYSVWWCVSVCCSGL